MRISDWSSDVCSSDLIRTRTVRRRARLGRWVSDGEADSCADRDEPRRDRHAGRRGTRQGPDHNRILGSLAAAPESEFPGIPRIHRGGDGGLRRPVALTREQRSGEHTSELQSLMRISYTVFCLKKKNTTNNK